ncbi:protein S100-A16 [Microcaecilia unicolor]|uniref:Protein S100 n=1 Tax=Microcaecilia unicolor TaxID=1415580 RepID=A0A6P7YUD7_9AMPH|nr:protein S100-A16-like [Microcaecilia unicolor]
MASSCSELEKSIEVLVRNFYKYAEKKGEKDKMTKKEFRKMVGSELNHILTNTQSKEGVDKLIKSLDADEDGKISFDEYWTLIGEIAKKLSQQISLQIQDAPQSSQPGN